jgi:hypothetical protein
LSRYPAAWAIAALLGCWGCDSSHLAGPAGPPVQPGLYILTDIGSVPAPYAYERAVYGDTAVVTWRFAFDSIRIVTDTTFERHFRREVVVTRPTIPPIVQGADEFRYTGLILDRGDEIKLTVRSGSLPGGHDLAYFTPVEGGTALVRPIATRESTCEGTRCEIIREARVMASYARQ